MPSQQYDQTSPQCVLATRQRITCHAQPSIPGHVDDIWKGSRKSCQHCILVSHKITAITAITSLHFKSTCCDHLSSQQTVETQRTFCSSPSTLPIGMAHNGSTMGMADLNKLFKPKDTGTCHVSHTGCMSLYIYIHIYTYIYTLILDDAVVFSLLTMC